MNMLFADIRGFTTLTERMGTQKAFAMLNEILAAVEAPIENEKGFVNQCQGDAIFALYPGEADATLRCTIAMVKEIQTLNVRRKSRNEAEIRFGLGISSGPLMLGAIGGVHRLESNVVGDTVNLSAWTESLTKLFGSQFHLQTTPRNSLANRRSLKSENLTAWWLWDGRWPLRCMN